MQTLPGSGFASRRYLHQEPEDIGTPLQCCPSVQPLWGGQPTASLPPEPREAAPAPPRLRAAPTPGFNNKRGGRDKGALQEGRGMQDEGLAGGEGGGLQGWDEGHAEAPAQQLWRGPAAHQHISLKKQHSQNGVNCRHRKSGINGNWL